MRLSFPILVMLIKIIEHVIAHAMRVVFCLEEIYPYFESKAFCYARNNCNIIFTTHRVYIFGRNLGKAPILIIRMQRILTVLKHSDNNHNIFQNVSL